MLVRTCMILLISRAGGERDEGLYRNFCHLFCVVCKPTSPLLTSFLLFVEIDGFFILSYFVLNSLSRYNGCFN